MISRGYAWYLGRSQREQRLLLVAAILAALTFGWFGILKPISDGLESTQAHYRGAVVRLAETESQIKALGPLLRDRPPPLQVPLETAIRQSAESAGFVLADVNPQPNNAVQVMMPSARPAAFFRWVADLETSGILVDLLTTADNGDQTISVQLTVKARGL